jgi:hypothetical protein
MPLLRTIRAARGGEATRRLGQQFGLGESEIEQAIQAIVPQLAHALRRLAESRTGAPVVHALMEEENYARYIDEPDALKEPQARADGDRVLEEILEGRYQRREITRIAANDSKLTEETIARLMPYIAVVTMGALGRSINEPSPSTPDRFETDQDDPCDDPIARVLASFFGEDDVSPSKEP